MINSLLGRINYVTKINTIELKPECSDISVAFNKHFLKIRSEETEVVNNNKIRYFSYPPQYSLYLTTSHYDEVYKFLRDLQSAASGCDEHFTTNIETRSTLNS